MPVVKVNILHDIQAHADLACAITFAIIQPQNEALHKSFARTVPSLTEIIHYQSKNHFSQTV